MNLYSKNFRHDLYCQFFTSLAHSPANTQFTWHIIRTRPRVEHDRWTQSASYKLFSGVCVVWALHSIRRDLFPTEEPDCWNWIIVDDVFFHPNRVLPMPCTRSMCLSFIASAQKARETETNIFLMHKTVFNDPISPSLLLCTCFVRGTMVQSLTTIFDFVQHYARQHITANIQHSTHNIRIK